MRDPYLGSQKQIYHLHDFHNIYNYCDLGKYISLSTTPPTYKMENIYSDIRYTIFKIYLYFATFSALSLYIYICINVIIFQKVSKFEYEGCLLRLGLKLS